MVPRLVVASALLLVFFGFGAWAQNTAIIMGEVVDGLTGDSVFGARIVDFTGALPIPGSFADNGDYFILDVPGGLRVVKVTAPGYFDGFDQVEVDVGQPAVLNFELVPDIRLNTAEITLPISGSEVETHLLPPAVYAFQDNVLVASTFVRSGEQFRISGLPDGKITFRAVSPFYAVGETTVELSGNREFPVTIPVSVPAARGPISGSVRGVVDDGELPIEAHVYATFVFEGVPVTVSSDSTAGTGAYQIDLLPPDQTADVEAYATHTTDRTPLPLASPFIAGGGVALQNLTVAAFDPLTLNFIPIVEGPSGISIEEDATRVLAIDEFTVTDSDNTFSTDHTLVIHPGLDYTRSDILPGSVQINLALDWNGTIIVPVSMSDFSNTSAPLMLTVTVNAVDDLTVYVDFDTGLPAGGGGTGGEANPFQAVGEALSAVAAGGTILIKGIASSTEAPFTINQDLSLQNNNSLSEVVSIAPSGARQVGATSPASSGFVTRSVRSSRNHRFGG